MTEQTSTRRLAQLPATRLRAGSRYMVGEQWYTVRSAQRTERVDGEHAKVAAVAEDGTVLVRWYGPRDWVVIPYTR